MAPGNCVDVNAAFAHRDVTSLGHVRGLFALVYGALFVLGVVFNGGVVATVARFRRLQSARNFFLLNLMAADLLLCFTAIPVTPVGVIQKRWIFGAFLCRVLPLSQSVAVFITSWSLAAIAVDKFVHIIDVTQEPIKLRQAALVTLCIWTVSTIVNIPYVLSNNLVDGDHWFNEGQADSVYCGKYCFENSWGSKLQQRVYGSSVMVLQFVAPMIIITFCYARILSKVHNDMIVANSQFAHTLSKPQRLDALRRRRRVNYILIAMVLAFVASWLPLTAMNIGRDFRILPESINLTPWIYTLIVHSVAMTTVIWNPLLFFWLTKRPETRSTIMAGANVSSAAVLSLAQRVGLRRSFFDTKLSADSAELTRRESSVSAVSQASTATPQPAAAGGHVTVAAETAASNSLPRKHSPAFLDVQRAKRNRLKRPLSENTLLVPADDVRRQGERSKSHNLRCRKAVSEKRPKTARRSKQANGICTAAASIPLVNVQSPEHAPSKPPVLYLSFGDSSQC